MISIGHQLLKTLFLEIEGWLKYQLILKMLWILFKELWAGLNELKFDGHAASSTEISVFGERDLVKESTNSKKTWMFFQKLWVGLVAPKFH